MPEKWWNQLQQLLDAQGSDLDLSNPEDRARLVTMDPFITEDGDWDVVMKFALGEANNVVDLKIDDDDQFEYDTEEFLKHQGKGPLNSVEIKRLYDAAKNGKLYVAPLLGSKSGDDYRKLDADENDNPVFHQDFLHLSSEDAKDFDILTVSPVPPEKPKSPSWGTSFLAFFGNKKAKAKIEEYKQDLAEYNENKTLYDERVSKIESIKDSKPWLVEYYNATEGLSHNPENRMGSAKLQGAFHKLHIEGMVKDYPEEQKTFQIDKIKKMARIQEIGKLLGEVKGNASVVDEQRDGTLLRDGRIQEQELLMLSEALCLNEEISRGEQLIQEGKIAEYEPKEFGTEEIVNRFNSKEFRDVYGRVNGEILFGFANKKLDTATAMAEINKIAEIAKNPPKPEFEKPEKTETVDAKMSAEYAQTIKNYIFEQLPEGAKVEDLRIEEFALFYLADSAINDPSIIQTINKQGLSDCVERMVNEEEFINYYNANKDVQLSDIAESNKPKEKEKQEELIEDIVLNQ